MATESKLAVILHADVVGSTALVRKNELLAHDRIRAVFETLSDNVRAYKGTVSEVRGDALVAEFARASDAVVAALAAQASNAKRDITLGDEVVPQMRAGIALGEVVIADNTVTGAGVVLAQRLEQLAEPGGVCVQGSVYEALSERLPLDYTSLGEQSVKGFDEPVRVYAVALRPGEYLPAPESMSSTGARVARARRHLTGAGVFAVLLISATLAWLQPWRAPPNPKLNSSESRGPNEIGPLAPEAKPEQLELPLPDKPSVAVLAFNNMSDDPKQDYFADGIAEDIITDLSKFTGLFVIARNSSFSYKGKAVPVRSIGRELGVGYVLEGSVRRAGDAVRINAQLIDATTGGHVWAERYDGVLSDVFGLQDSVTEKVVAALKVTLGAAEMAAVQTSRTSVPAAYDAYLTGVRFLDETRSTRDVRTNERARAAFETAISLDSKYARAYAGLAWTYWTAYAFAFGGGYDRVHNRERAWQIATQSLEHQDNALAHRILAKQYFDAEGGSRFGAQIDYDAAIDEVKKALAIEPNNADALVELAFILVYSEGIEEADRLLKRAKRLNPSYPAWYSVPTGIVAYQKGNYEEAIAELTPVYEATLYGPAHLWLVSALAHAGKVQEATDVLNSRNLIHVGTSQFALERRIPIKSARLMQQFLDGLGKAGLPKEPKAIN